MKEEERVPFEYNKICEMSKSLNLRPIRIVITSNGKIFVDNTHWAIAYMKRFGQDIKLSDVPFYIVDFNFEKPYIVDVKGTVIKNEQDIKRAVNAAGDVEERIQKGWRPRQISYLLGDFAIELEKQYNLTQINLMDK